MHYIPLTLPFFLALVFLFALLIVLIEINILEYAYEQIGVNRRYMFALLLLGQYCETKAECFITLLVSPCFSSLKINQPF